MWKKLRFKPKANKGKVPWLEAIMQNIKLILISIVLHSFLISLSHAGAAWTGNVGIKNIGVHTDYLGGFLGLTIHEAVVTNPAQCSDTSAYDIVYTVGIQETRSSLISLLYTAKASSKKVSLYRWGFV